ncbi:MAG: SCO family protein [Hyphomicrobiales bacterium]|nr:SCO family protein [Hyphomicrobiales bacterium]MCP5371193.1 SCO family protein [Hyphomicrobiales bacterium]
MRLRRFAALALFIAGLCAAAASPAGAAAPGGRFILWDKSHQAVTDQDFRGRFMLVFFGYTFCPDICPTSLNTIAEAMELLGKDAQQVVPIFISVDPARDTVEHLRDYVDAFDSRIVGLTGTPEMIARVAAAYKVTYTKVKEAGTEDDNYTIDHTASVFLMGPDGKFLVKFLHGITPEDLAKRIRDFL